jgi:hypothetical protein
MFKQIKTAIYRNIIFLGMLALLSYMLVISFTKERAAVGIPAQQFPIAEFEAANNPLYQYGLVKVQTSKHSKKIYKSILPLHADGRYEIKGGELDWKPFNFNSIEDISGEGIVGVGRNVKVPDGFPIAAAKLAVNYFDNLKTGCYALYDLDANGVDEIIVQSGFGSSGYQYAFLENQRGNWKIIEGFAGPFVLTSVDLWGDNKDKFSKNYWYIVHWWSSGNDFVQIQSAYKDEEYKLVSQQSVPYAVRELDFGRLNIDANCTD